MLRFVILAFAIKISSSSSLKTVEDISKNKTLGEYSLDKGWPHKNVSDLQVFGSSVTIDNSGNIVLLHRGFQGGSKPRNSIIHENTVAIIDKNTGKILREWGSNKFLKPHGLFINKDGDLFITDTVMHQIFKVTTILL